jgi:hypothetical protein
MAQRDPFKEIQKAFRSAWFSVVERAGHTDWDCKDEFLVFQHNFNQLMDAWVLHVKLDTDVFVPALREKCGKPEEAAEWKAYNDKDIENLEKLQAVIGNESAPGTLAESKNPQSDGEDFYRELCLYVADMLQHMTDVEKTKSPPLLEKHNPEEMKALMMQCHSSVPPHNPWLQEFMFRAFNTKQRAGLLTAKRKAFEQKQNQWAEIQTVMRQNISTYQQGLLEKTLEFKLNVPHVDFSGRFEMYRTENFKNFLMACGMPEFKTTGVVNATCIQHVKMPFPGAYAVRIWSNCAFLNTPGYLPFICGADEKKMKDMSKQWVIMKTSWEGVTITTRFTNVATGRVLTSRRVMTQEGQLLINSKNGVETKHWFRRIRDGDEPIVEVPEACVTNVNCACIPEVCICKRKDA